MQKAFENFTWENSPSTATPMGAALLNTLNEAINEIDNRVCEQDGEISEVVVKTRDIIEKAEKAAEKAEEVAVIAEASAALAKEASEEAKEASEEIKASTEAIAKNTEDIERIDGILPTKADASALNDKMNNPASEGTDGQVLATDGNGGRYWKTVSGGGGGTSDYSDLSNKPQINSVTLSGNKSLTDLGIASQSDLNALSNIVGTVNAMLQEV